MKKDGKIAKKLNFSLARKMTSPVKNAVVSTADGAERKNLKELDGWIEQLYRCEQLNEGQVKMLCDKVIL